MIGVFINNLVLRVPVDPRLNFEEHLSSATKTVSAAVNHQRMPFNKLVEFINPVRDPSRNPLISVNFNLSKAFMEDRRYGDFELLSAASQSPGVVYDISFGMVGRPSGWRMSIEYNTDLFERSTIERILRIWQEVYEQALTSPTVALSSAETGTASATERDAGRHVAGRDGQLVLEQTTDGLVRGQTLATTEASPAEPMRLLADIWARILDVKQIGPDADFFALGGHSLLALRMLSAVKETFGVRPELTLLFKQPTLKGFGEALFGPLAVETIPAKGDAAPVFERTTLKQGTGAGAVYSINHPFLYYQLANRLDDSLSVHNVNMFDASEADLSAEVTLEAVAASAIRAMEIPENTGPIGIVGLCVNGILAIEVARQLREAGVDVAFTAAIDSWAPGYFRAQPWLRQRLWNGERRFKRVIYFTGRLLKGRIRPVAFMKEFRITRWLLGAVSPSRTKASAEESANVRTTDFLVRLARNYKAKPVGELMLFKSEASPKRARRLLFGWDKQLVGEASLIDLEGWHEDSLTIEGMRRLADAFNDRLGQAKQ